MNRTIRNLVIAAPLATIALTLVPVGAHAEPKGPVIVIQPNGGDPEPKPDFPIAIPDKPKGPQDKAPKPAAKPQPQGGGNQVVAAPKAAPNADTTKTAATAVEVVSAKGSADSIDRSDALFVTGPIETTLVADKNDDGLDVTWLLIGGAVVTASGVAFAARKRSNA